MRNLLLLAAFIVSIASYSQNKIILTNGDILHGKVQDGYDTLHKKIITVDDEKLNILIKVFFCEA